METFKVGQVAYVHTQPYVADLFCGDTTVVKVARTGTVTLANKQVFYWREAFGKYMCGKDPDWSHTLHSAPVSPWNAKGLNEEEFVRLYSQHATHGARARGEAKIRALFNSSFFRN